jgi:NADPH2 dehydrogenase
MGFNETLNYGKMKLKELIIRQSGGYDMRTFEPYRLKAIELKNRIVMPPMCMYSSDETGILKDFHTTHYISRAIGGVGLIIVEATGVTPEGRISERDLGIWNDQQRDAFIPMVQSMQSYGSKVAIQLAHSGRKHVGKSQMPVGPSTIAFDDESRVPLELSVTEIVKLVESFKKAAIRADAAGFDVIEIHSAHGYLLHEFLSPISNHRTDAYGGTLENRVRFLKEVLSGVRDVLGPDKPILLRISATDYLEGGLTCDDLIDIVTLVKGYIDMVHVSSGGLVNVPMKVHPGYQLEFSRRIRKVCGIPTIAVGLITNIEMVEEILGSERGDLVAMGRELLRNPQFVLNAAMTYKAEIAYPHQYERAFI